MRRRKDDWYPFSPGDYARDTAHLTTIEHGAYRLLLDAAWPQCGRLPDDDLKLASITKMTARAWQKIAPTVRAFFRTDGNHLVQKRMASEYEKTVEISAKRSASGAKGGRPKKANGKQNETHAGVLIHLPSEEPLPPEVPRPKGSDRSEPKGSSLVIVPDDPPVPSDELERAFADYNEVAAELGLPIAKVLTKARRTAMRLRMKEHGPGCWYVAMSELRAAPFLRGEGPRNWRADLDFVLQPKSFARLVEGSYGGLQNGQRSDSERRGDARSANLERAFAATGRRAGSA